MRLKRHGFLLLLSSLLAAQPAIGVEAHAQTASQPDTMPEAIPGPRDCFWRRGPFGADPYINLAYPDANVFYWAAVFSMPEGASLRLEGEYPQSRYASFVSYDGNGRPIESLPDFLIAPEDGPNPFTEGARRDASARGYAITIRNSEPETIRAIGSRERAGEANALHSPAYGAQEQQAVLYRIYLPDDGHAPAGGVPLPEPVLETADGERLRGAEACTRLRTAQPVAMSPDAASIPPARYRALINQPDRPDTWPAENPATWHIQLDRESLLGIYTGEINDDARRSEGGFYPNPDNFYIRTIVNRKHGPVFLLRARAPSTPQTHSGDPVMGEGQLRYWSVCSNQSFVNTRVNDCLFDEEIPVDPAGFFTVVVSREEDRPRNARPECGIGWLPMADDGDGMFDEDVTIVQVRHMLGADDFEHSIERVQSQDTLEATLGPYMPRTRYFQTNQVEAFFPCPAQ